MAKLSIHDLTVRYGKLTALRGANFRLLEGETLFISGPNGAGKSTLLGAVCGVIPTAHGRVEIDGDVTSGMMPETIARLGVSMVPEGREIFGTLTIEENLMVGTGMRRDQDSIREDRDLIYEAFPILAERRHAQAGVLSGGQQQMLAIGRALMTNPKLLLIDEPSLGLAPKVVDQVYEKLLDLRDQRGLTLLIVEQSSVRAGQVGGRMIIMQNGQIVADGQASDLAKQDVLKDAYFGQSTPAIQTSIENPKIKETHR